MKENNLTHAAFLRNLELGSGFPQYTFRNSKNQVRKMDFVTVACENGHRIKAKTSLGGQTHGCPRCGKLVTIPVPPQQEKDPLTDTGIMRILGTQEPLPPAPKPQKRNTLRVCPRCDLKTPSTKAVCDHCNCYLGATPDFMGQMFSPITPRSQAG